MIGIEDIPGPPLAGRIAAPDFYRLWAERLGRRR